MADDVDESSSQSDRNKKKRCEICLNNIRTGGIKCANGICDVLLHVKCFEAASKVFNLVREDWRCCKCTEIIEESDPEQGDMCESELSSDTNNNCVAFLRKEIVNLNTQIALLNKIIRGLENTNSLQSEKLQELSAKTVSTSVTDKSVKPSYSGIVKSNLHNAKDSNVLIIKSSDRAIANSHVMHEIKNAVKPADHNIYVNSTKLIQGGLLVNCNDINSLDKLKNELVNKFGNKYLIGEPRKLNPRIKINRVEEYENNEKFIEGLFQNNPELKDINSEFQVKVITTIKSKFNRSLSVVIEVSATLRKYIIAKGFLYVGGWQKCAVEDHLMVTRCFHCSQYGHNQKNCKNEKKVCPLCSGDHDRVECTAEIKKCINCVTFNQYNKNNMIPTDHAVVDVNNCLSYQHKIELLKSKINYG